MTSRPAAAAEARIRARAGDHCECLACTLGKHPRPRIGEVRRKDDTRCRNLVRGSKGVMVQGVGEPNPRGSKDWRLVCARCAEARRKFPRLFFG